MNRARWQTFLLMTALAVLVGACNLARWTELVQAPATPLPNDLQPQATATLPAIGGETPAFGGDYRVTISVEDVSNARQFPQAAGDWLIRFSDPQAGRGYYEAYLADALFTTGEYALENDHIVLSRNTNGCENDNGDYLWAFDGTYLTLTALNEACTSRAFVLATHPLARQP